MSFLNSIFKTKSDPSFLVIGAQKAGTTSLFNYLCQHPKVFIPSKKEIHYFDVHYKKGIDWYQRELSHNKFKSFEAIGEISPYYLFHPLVPQRIQELYPSIKLFFLLREPVERAYSHFTMQSNKKEESRTFAEAIENEFETIKKEERLINKLDKQSPVHQLESYLSRGLYAAQLQRWYKHFDQSQFHIMEFGDFTSNTNSEMQRLFKFLDLPSYSGNYTQVFPSNYQQALDEQLKKELREYFNPHNAELYSLLNKKFDW